MAAKTKLGKALVAEGLIDEFQLRAALGEQSRWGNRLGETLVRMGFLPESELVRVLGKLLRVAVADLGGKAIEPEILDLLPQAMAEKLQCIPLFLKRQGGVELLYLGMHDPTDLSAIDEVSFRTGLGVRPVLVGPVQLRHALATSYRGQEVELAVEREIVEAPVVPGDTAPVFEGAPRGDHGDWSDAPEFEATDPTPAPPVASEPVATAPDLDGSASPPTEKPRDVPTRQILQALTRLLVEKGIVNRQELLDEIRAVQREAAAGRRDAKTGA